MAFFLRQSAYYEANIDNCRSCQCGQAPPPAGQGVLSHIAGVIVSVPGSHNHNIVTMEVVDIAQREGRC